MRVLLVLLAALILVGGEPSSVYGWRLLYAGDGLDGQTLYTYLGGLAAAVDNSSYATLWSESGATQDRPAINFDREIVALFADERPPDCKPHLTGVTFGPSHPTRVSVEDGIADFGGVLACSLMPGSPWVYVIALSRSKFDMRTIELVQPYRSLRPRVLTVDLTKPGLYYKVQPTAAADSDAALSATYLGAGPR